MKSLLGGYFFQPASEKQFSSLTAKVELLKNKYPDSYQKKKSTKILAAIRQIIITLSIDPTQPIFRQGKTLGDQYLNWHRLNFAAHTSCSVRQQRRKFILKIVLSVCLADEVQYGQAFLIFGQTQTATQLLQKNR